MIREKVQSLYERFPFPGYPIALPLQWQDGYLCSSLFAARLLESSGYPSAMASASSPRVLVVGCGDTQPYVMRRWEPWHHHMTFVDISQRSIFRAKCRNYVRGMIGQQRFVAGDIDEFLRGETSLARDGVYAHIDAYGVLHHLESPSRTIRALGEVVQDYGTMRVMVYNASARRWIRQLQRGFRCLKLDPHYRRHRRIAKQLLATLAEAFPSLRSKLARMPLGGLVGQETFMDTFFQQREVPVALSQWLDWLRQSGFEAFALLDRYDELPDSVALSRGFPCPFMLERAAVAGDFQNNFELYCFRKPRSGMTSLPVANNCHDFKGTIGARLARQFAYRWLWTRSVPSLWRQRSDGLRGRDLRRYWHRWLRWVFLGEGLCLDRAAVAGGGFNWLQKVAALTELEAHRESNSAQEWASTDLGLKKSVAPSGVAEQPGDDRFLALKAKLLRQLSKEGFRPDARRFELFWLRAFQAGRDDW